MYMCLCVWFVFLNHIIISKSQKLCICINYCNYNLKEWYCIWQPGCEYVHHKCVCIFSYSPNKFTTMWTEGGLTQECCHKLMSIDLSIGNREWEKIKSVTDQKIWKSSEITWCTRRRIAPRRRLNPARSLNSLLTATVCSTSASTLAWSVKSRGLQCSKVI